MKFFISMKSIPSGLAVLTLTGLCPLMSLAQTQPAPSLRQQVDQFYQQGVRNHLFPANSGPKYADLLKAVQPALDRAKQELNQETLQKAARGGVDSGGATGYRGGLLDLALYNPAISADQTPGLVLPITKPFKVAGLDTLNSPQSEIFQKAVAQVQKWSTVSSDTAGEVLEAMKLLKIYYTDGEMTRDAQEYYLPSTSRIQTSELKMLAFYTPSLGTFISKRSFEKLSEKNQIALLIHESLRYRQVILNTVMTNNDVQKLTAAIMSEPTPGKSLDTFEIMSAQKRSRYLQRQVANIKILQMSERFCPAYHMLCDGAIGSNDLETFTNMILHESDPKRMQELINASMVYSNMLQDFIDCQAESSAEGFAMATAGMNVALSNWPLDAALEDVRNGNFLTTGKSKELLGVVHSVLKNNLHLM